MEAFKPFESREQNQRIIKELNGYLAQGYVLHGGKSDTLILEPRQATDTDPERKIGKSYALYADGDDIRIPIFMALRSAKDPYAGEGFSSSYSGHGPDQPLRISGRNLAFTPGFVHVLPRDTFEIEQYGEDAELVSKTPVTSVKIIAVEPSILDEFSDLKIEIEN